MKTRAFPECFVLRISFVIRISCFVIQRNGSSYFDESSSGCVDVSATRIAVKSAGGAERFIENRVDSTLMFVDADQPLLDAGNQGLFQVFCPRLVLHFRQKLADFRLQVRSLRQ